MANKQYILIKVFPPFKEEDLGRQFWTNGFKGYEGVYYDPSDYPEFFKEKNTNRAKLVKMLKK